MRITRFAAKFGVAAAIAVGIGIGAPALASAAPAAPAVTATPSTGLATTQTITVSGTGLTGGDVFYVGQCVAVAATDYACDHNTSVAVTSTTAGTISTPLTVNRTFVGTTVSGATHAVDCKVDDCVVSALSASIEGGAVPISFAG